MSNFKKLNANVYNRKGSVLTEENLYWKQFSVPVLVKEYGAIDYIDFSRVEPHFFAITCSVRVQIYNPITKLVVKNLSKFQENAYGGSFRSDGKLLVAGDEQNHVKLFDVSTRSILRSFNGHKGPVHRTFFTSDMTHIASFSDDKTVKVWDIPTEKVVNTFAEHTDYIRAGCVSPTSPNIILSGGYDKIIKMYDTRTNSSIFEVKHDSPVESLIFLPSGGIFLSAGGTSIKVWDALSGGKLFAELSQHHKTVTSLCLGSNGKRILSGGLDRHVKIYDVSSYEVVHNLDFPNAVLSIAVSANNSSLVVGMVDGLVSIHRREDKEEEDTKIEKRIAKKINLEDKFNSVLINEKSETEAAVNKCLRKFQYVNALTAVMKKYVVNKNPHITTALIEELMRRKGLEQALSGRSHNFIANFVKFLFRYISVNRFTSVLIAASNILLDIYEDRFEEFTGEIGQQFFELAKKLAREEELTLKCLELIGEFELITSGATAINNNIIQTNFKKLTPSDNANRHTVINVD